MFKSLLKYFKRQPAGYRVDLGNGAFVFAATAEQAAEFAYIIHRNDDAIKEHREKCLALSLEAHRIQRITDALNGHPVRVSINVSEVDEKFIQPLRDLIDSSELPDRLPDTDTRVARQEHMPHNRIASGNHPKLKGY